MKQRGRTQPPGSRRAAAAFGGKAAAPRLGREALMTHKRHGQGGIFRAPRALGAGRASDGQRGTTPSRPTLMRSMSKLPSNFLTALKTVNAAPGLTALMSPTSNRAIGTSGVTMIFFSPSLNLTVITGPSTPVTVVPTVPLVIVLLGALSHGRKPSPVPRIASAKM